MATTPGVSFGSGGRLRTVTPRLEIHLGASQAALLTTKEEASTARMWLAESDAMVVGKMNSKKTIISISTVFVLIAPLFL